MSGKPLQIGTILGGVLIILFGVGFFYRSYTALQSQAREKRAYLGDILRLSGVLKSPLEERARSLKSITRSVGESFWLKISLRNASYNEIGKALDPFLASFEEIRGISIVSYTGEVVWEGGISARYTPEVLRKLLEVEEGEVFFGGEWGKGEERFLQFCSGVTRGGRRVGGATLVFSSSSLIEVLEDFAPLKREGLYLLSDEDEVLFKTFGEGADSLFPVSKVVGKKGGEFVLQLGEREYSLSLIPLTEIPWKLLNVFPLPKEELTLDQFLLSRQGIYFIPMGVLGLLFILFGLLVPIRRERKAEGEKKLEELQAYLHDLSFEDRLGSPPLKEMEPLVSNFNRILEELKRERLEREEGMVPPPGPITETLEDLYEVPLNWVMERGKTRAVVFLLEGKEGKPMLLERGLSPETKRLLFEESERLSFLKKEGTSSGSLEAIEIEELRRALEDEGIKAFVALPVLKGVNVLALYEEENPDLSSMEETVAPLRFSLEVLREILVLREEKRELRRKLLGKDIIVETLTRQLGTTRRIQSEFLSAVSHELRTPLNAIIGFSELLLDGEYGDLPDEQKRALENIHQSGSYLLNLINDILDLVRVESGEVQLKKEPLSVRDVIQRLTKMAKGLTGKKRLEILSEVDPSIDKMITDSTIFKQIVFNLLSNAVKFTPDRGKIRVKVQRIKDQLFLTVSDTGIGLRREDLERIFEPFFQTENGAQRGGVGLGLSLVKRYAEMLGGTVWAESAGVGKGSSFTVALPIEPVVEPRPEIGEAPLREAPGEAPLAIVVEDDVPAAELLTKILTSQGYRVLWAADGSEGLRWVKEYTPKVVFLDLLLPKVDGWAFLQALRESDIQIPVIVVSILDRDEEAMRLGASQYIVKPITKESVLDALATTVGDDPEEKCVFVVEGKDSSQIVSILERMGYKVRLIGGERSSIEDSEIVVATLRDLGVFLRTERGTT